MLRRPSLTPTTLPGLSLPTEQIITGLRPVRAHMPSPAVPAECPQEAADLMSACCSLDPAERPSAKEVMQRLRAMLAAQQRGRLADFS